MSEPMRTEFETEDEAAEREAFAAAVAEAEASTLFVPHAEMRQWLLRVAAGEFDAPPPVARPWP